MRPYDISKIIKIQSWFRGCYYRQQNLPNSILHIQKTLKSSCLDFYKENEDGRINSCFDETLATQ